MADKSSSTKKQNSEAYLKKRSFFANMLTIYGRKPVLEAISDESIEPFRLHLAESNKSAKILDEIINTAERRNIDIRYHSKQALSRISKNGKQDQGIALDLKIKNLQTDDDFLEGLPDDFEIIALDGITNPQNLGMIIRSVCASPIKGILLPANGSAKLDALAIKASAGTVFKAPIISCENLEGSLRKFIEKDTQIVALDSNAKTDLANFTPAARTIYVFGNESEGPSKAVLKLVGDTLKIRMHNGVESLNVAVAASLIAFRKALS